MNFKISISAYTEDICRKLSSHFRTNYYPSSDILKHEISKNV